ncbi:hypothetical protein B0T26DRAFT_673397 [Lasiosphaeria miniovina]|uniref:SH3 domain-containing protein n=1 Tax=Lasiosphaeria miniovina TaxID=1954250 RepID=A0AA40AT94_9PEZI|nr:uncharacterized protein B0T26DRAFT_673397 [Lasiosphaeria miniovina]KAK0721591.1 hypothetical protein B0T26DRAFT_673397 [Lasiosphaeria miniovina]
MRLNGVLGAPAAHQRRNIFEEIGSVIANFVDAGDTSTTSAPSTSASSETASTSAPAQTQSQTRSAPDTQTTDSGTPTVPAPPGGDKDRTTVSKGSTVTGKGSPTPTPTPTPSPKTTPKPSGQAVTTPTTPENDQVQQKAPTPSISVSIPPGNTALNTLPPGISPISSVPLDSTLALAPSTQPSTTTFKDVRQSQTATSSGSKSAATTSASSDSGGGETSAAAKAGIVIGVLAGVLLVSLGAWFFFQRRRRQMERDRRHRDHAEKINNPFSDKAAIRTPVTAPRLSLRPVTQFLPNLGSNNPERRNSRGIALTVTPPSEAPGTRPAGAAAWERPAANSAMNNAKPPYDRPGTGASANPANPFNDSQRIAEPATNKDLPVSPVSSIGHDDDFASATGQSPEPEPVSPIGGTMNSTDAAAVGAVAGGAAAASAAGMTRKASIRKDLSKPLDLTKAPPALSAVPPSPTGTEFSMHSVAPGQSPAPSTSAAAIAAAGGPPQSAVHRVQLDFKPTLEDEMGLVAGQLVRLLHEYDDGWALCIRLDRSQQGVVPRTCLSTRPVKPRPGPGAPRGPPVNSARGAGGYPPSQNQQGYSPNTQYQRPQQSGRPTQGPGQGYPRSYSPAGDHPASPAGRSMSPGPGHGQPQSQGPRYNPQQGRPRSPNGPGRGPSPTGATQPGQDYYPAESPSAQYQPGQAY